MSVTPYLNTIWQHLSEMNYPTIRCMNEGISAEKIEELLKSLPFQIPSALKEVYQWKNGVNMESCYKQDLYIRDADLVPYFYLMSLEHAIDIYQDEYHPELNMVKNGINDPWQENWLPILADDNESFYILDCGTGKIFALYEDWRTEQLFISVEKMLETFAAAFEAKIFYIDKDNESFLSRHESRYYELAKKLNPEISFWERARS